MTILNSLKDLYRGYREHCAAVQRSTGIILHEDMRTPSGELTQKAFGKLAGVSTSTIRRCLSDKDDEDIHRLSLHNILHLSRSTGIPHEVVVRCASGYPIRYSFRERRYSVSMFEWEIIRNSDRAARISDIRDVEKYDVYKYGQVYQVRESENNLKDIEEFIKESYPSNYLFDNWSVRIRESINELRSGNIIVRDINGLYCGHIITIPLGLPSGLAWMDAIENEEMIFTDNKDDSRKEREILTSSDIKTKDVQFHVYSFHAVHSVYAYILLSSYREFIESVRKLCSGSNYFSAYPVREDARIVFENVLGLKPRAQSTNPNDGSVFMASDMNDVISHMSFY